MSGLKELLRDLETHFTDPAYLDRAVSRNRHRINYGRWIRELQPGAEGRPSRPHPQSEEQIRAAVSRFPITHRTSLDSVLGILKHGGLLSIARMEKLDISFNFRVTERGVNDKMHGFVFCQVGEGFPGYGPYRIHFKREVALLPGALMLPRGALHFRAEQINDYLVGAGQWSEYITQYILVRLASAEEYFAKVPAHQRVELLVPDTIPLALVEGIHCATEAGYGLVRDRIRSEFGPDSPFLTLIRPPDGEKR